MEKTTRYVRVCPECGSQNIKDIIGGQLGGIMHCMGCGFRGIMVEKEVRDV